MKKIFVLLLIPSLFVLAGCNREKPAPAPSAAGYKQEQPISENIIATETPKVAPTQTETVPVKTPLVGVQDCKESFTCFTEALNKCQPAKYTYKFNGSDLSGTGQVNMVIAYEIKGWEGKNCLLQNKVLSYDFKYNQKTIDLLKSSGQTETEIAQKAESVSKSMINPVETCRSTDAQNLLVYLNNMKNLWENKKMIDFSCEDANYGKSNSKTVCTYEPGVICE